MDHQEDALLIALHEAQMVLSEAARPLQELRLCPSRALRDTTVFWTSGIKCDV